MSILRILSSASARLFFISNLFQFTFTTKYDGIAIINWLWFWVRTNRNWEGCFNRPRRLKARSITFFGQVDSTRWALQKTHLGPPGRERATDIDIHLVDAVRSTPQVDFGQIGRLGSWKGGPTWPGGGVCVNRDCAPKSSIAVSFISNLSHLGSPPGRIPQVPTVLKGGYLWNPDTTRSNDFALLYNIFDPFSLLFDPININHEALYIGHSIYRRAPFWRIAYRANAFYQVESTPALASRRGAYTPQIAPRWAVKVSTWLRPPGGADMAQKSYRTCPLARRVKLKMYASSSPP